MSSDSENSTNNVDDMTGEFNKKIKKKKFVDNQRSISWH